MKPEYPKLTQVHKNLGKCAILPSLFLFTLISEEILKKNLWHLMRNKSHYCFLFQNSVNKEKELKESSGVLGILFEIIKRHGPFLQLRLLVTSPKDYTCCLKYLEKLIRVISKQTQKYLEK